MDGAAWCRMEEVAESGIENADMVGDAFPEGEGERRLLKWTI